MTALPAGGPNRIPVSVPSLWPAARLDMAGGVALPASTPDHGDLYRRHDLVWLSADASFPAAELSGPWVLAATTPEQQRAGSLRLGRCAASAAGRPLRVAANAELSAVRIHRPPLAPTEVLDRLPALDPAWRALLRDIAHWAAANGVRAGIYGSLAWQALLGERPGFLHADSDIDVLVDGCGHSANAAVAGSLRQLLALGAASEQRGGPRIDGEWRLPDGGDVSLRELADGLGGVASRVLVRQHGQVMLRSVSLAGAPALLRRRPAPRHDPALLDQLALAALRREAGAWPKPGLVSPVDRGSHHDMDVRLLLAAIDALRGWFAEMAGAALRGACFAQLAAVGRAAEAAMFDATGGVNAYKGAIFHLGLLAAGAATAPPGWAPQDWVRRRWGDELLAHRPAGATHGAEVRRRDGAGGAIGEAARGFPTLVQVVLPALQAARARGFVEERASIAALLASIEVLEDTNLLWRGGRDGLSWARAQAGLALRRDLIGRPDWRAALATVHRAFVQRRLSPGGSADLLACAHFLQALEGPGMPDAARQAAAQPMASIQA
ncbi:MAG: triphosphoribosyl-dephospho-CoA synthase [Pseudomonadota bacterium]|nr:triphosphoribosyl-dephospho-CoA synthase [Pseudomonadota bacterium]